MISASTELCDKDISPVNPPKKNKVLRDVSKVVVDMIIIYIYIIISMSSYMKYIYILFISSVLYDSYLYLYYI